MMCSNESLLLFFVSAQVTKGPLFSHPASRPHPHVPVSRETTSQEHRDRLEHRHLAAFYFLMYQLAGLVSLCECWRGVGADGVKMQFVMRSELSERRMEVIKVVCWYAGLAVGIRQNSPIEIRYRDGLLTSLSRFR